MMPRTDGIRARSREGLAAVTDNKRRAVDPVPKKKRDPSLTVPCNHRKTPGKGSTGHLGDRETQGRILRSAIVNGALHRPGFQSSANVLVNMVPKVRHSAIAGRVRMLAACQGSSLTRHDQPEAEIPGHVKWRRA